MLTEPLVKLNASRKGLKALLAAFFLALMLLNSGVAQAGVRCEAIFSGQAPAKIAGLRAKKALSTAILSFGKAISNGVTSLRQEDKYVVVKEAAEGLLSELSEQYGANLSLRDQRAEGQKNVTVTQYMRPILIDLKNGRVLSAKIRFRKYFQTAEKKTLAMSNLKPSSATAKRQYFEIKIDHPLYDRTVLKPRLLIDDADVAIVRSASRYQEQRRSLRERWLQLNPETSQDVVDSFLATLDQLYAQTKSDMQAFAETKYVRESYSLKIPPSNPAQSPLEVQVTVDREVSVQSPGHPTLTYSPHDVVVEVKVPLAHAALTKADMKAYPGLASVKEVKSALKFHHNNDYQRGTGKLSTFRRFVRKLDD